MGYPYLDHEILPCVIGGKAHQTKKTFDLIDPHDSDGKLLYKVYGAQVEDAMTAVDAAHKAFPAWSVTPAIERRAIFQKAAALTRERMQELIDCECAETTSAQSWASLTIGKFTPEALEESAAVVTQLHTELAPSPTGQITYVERVPYGVVLAIAPWNAPMILGSRAVRDAIMAGNTVVLKASELSPRIQQHIVQIFEDAGLPKGVLNILHVATEDAPKVIESIIARREVGKLNFTGSTFVGSKILEMAARHIKPSTMELGGKAPFIVLPSADVEAAAHAAMYGGMAHQGQVCMSTDIIICHEDVADAFAEALRKEFADLAADKQGPFLRGVFAIRSAQRLDGFVKDALGKGAKVLAGTTEGRSHNIMQPLVLDGVTDDMLIAREELFGPMIGVRRFKTDEEALEYANASNFGLSSAVFGRDIEHALRIARGIVTGACHINGITIHDSAQIPHGGTKASGFGRFNGIEGLREFTYTKVVTVNTPHRFM